MDFTGYNVLLKGEPAREVEALPEAEALKIPLSSKRFSFSDVCVEDGANVKQGDVLARDPGNHSLPFLAPRSGSVRVDHEYEQIIIQGPRAGPDTVSDAGKDAREKLVRLGAWQFFSEAMTGRLPDPAGTPKAVIVSVVRLEPFTASAEVLLEETILDFIRGLEHLKALLGEVPVYLVVPTEKFDVKDLVKSFLTMPLAESNLRDMMAGVAKMCPWINTVDVLMTYPHGKGKLIAQKLGLGKDFSSDVVWATDVEGVLAVDRALSASAPSVSRTIAVGGPGVSNPTHVEVPVGYPLKAILEACGTDGEVRVINGGVMTGETFSEEQFGVDVECNGITVVPECTTRELAAWANPGFLKHGYMHAFASLIYPFFRERYSTGLRGEHRPCISCAACENVCPANLMPYLMVRYLDNDKQDEARKIGLEKCLNCGSCTYVCTSKIEHRTAFVDAQQEILKEAGEAGS